MKKGTLTFADGQFHLDVMLQDETVWLTQEQMGALFERDKSTISRHIRNVYKEGELEFSATVAKNATVQQEGQRQVKREIELYNLDVIISVGYRVKSKRGTQFRIWAMQILKQYLLQGCALNQQKLSQQGADIQALLGMFENVLAHHQLEQDETQALAHVIKQYARSFSLLQQYDAADLSEPKGAQPSKPLALHEVRQALAILKETLCNKQEATHLFAQERDNTLAAILGNIEQTFDGQALYPTVESKAAHLLYFIVKDHPFTDGNKRSAAFLFLQYLAQNSRLAQANINENGLVALTLLIAESDPQQKELMILLIQNLLSK